MKKCLKCGERKELSEYTVSDKKKGYLKSRCKMCFRKWKPGERKYIPKEIKFKDKWGSGVYGIFESGKCLYVGESKVLALRINNHKSYYSNLSDKLINHPAFIIGIIENTLNHKEREKYWIEKFNPLYNILYK
tara:strand:+ start:88 stop:486 length:399 start_codon:yes stop_codon:yes gene_type:complete